MEEEVKTTSVFPLVDRETFKALKEEILPQLISRASRQDHVLRLWIAQCATGEDAVALCVLLADLLGKERSRWRIKIFATDSQETTLALARRNTYTSAFLDYFRDLDPLRFFEQTEHGYQLSPLLKNLIFFGKHNFWHDLCFVRLDLLLYRQSLLKASVSRQQHVLEQMSRSLKPGGYLVFPRADAPLLAGFPYQQMGEGVPIYQQVKPEAADQVSSTPPVQKLERKESLIETMQDLLSIPFPQGTKSLEPLSCEDRSALSSVRSSLDVVFHLAPTGIVIIDHRYQILTSNRTADKLLTPLIHDEKHKDLFHVVPGLPYTQVRTALDQVLREGTSQTLPEVELTVSGGGNGRVLSFTISLMPTQIEKPPQVVLYICDTTELTVLKKIQSQQTALLQEQQLAISHLAQKYSSLQSAHERLSEISAVLLAEYQRIDALLKATQEAREQAEQQIEQLLEEIRVLGEEQ